MSWPSPDVTIAGWTDLCLNQQGPPKRRELFESQKKEIKIRRPRLQQGERVRGGITSSKGQEVITSSKGKKQENKKEEARSNYRQQAARSKKQEARKQQAAGRQVRELVFLSIQKATLGRRLEDSSES